MPRPSSRSSVPEGLEQHIDPEQVPARTDVAAWREQEKRDTRKVEVVMHSDENTCDPAALVIPAVRVF